eukprot:scaffold44129_cov61-Phaeocystis_antarctica.AAC.7
MGCGAHRPWGAWGVEAAVRSPQRPWCYAIRQGLDVEGDDRPHLVERAHLTDDPHDGTLPASRAATGR